MRTIVLIAHDPEDLEKAKRLAEPIEAAGYDVFHYDLVLVGDSWSGEVSRIMARRGPVVICGTRISAGSSEVEKFVRAAQADSTVPRVFAARMEKKANVEGLSLGTVCAECWDQFFDGGVTKLIAALKEYHPPEAGTAPILDAAQAARLLAAMPLDVIPEPGAVPAGSVVVYPRNPLFVGRAADLRALAAALKAGGTAAIGQIAAATGLGGIGKTQLANEFVHRYGRYFAGGVFWLSFADPASVAAEIGACGGPAALGLWPAENPPALADQVRLVRAAWQRPLPCLLAFDNCEDEALLAEWRSPCGGARVLVTRRRDRWSLGLGVVPLPLGVLAAAESLALLHQFRPDLPANEPGLAAIAGELGHLPLALHLAGSYLDRYRDAPSGRPSAYLAALRRADLLDHRSLTAGDHSPTGHEQHVARTFALSHDRLDPADPPDAVALDVLARAACFAPGEPIPRDLLRLCLNPAADEAAAAEAFEDAVLRLRALGLVTAADGTLTLHRLLAA